MNEHETIRDKVIPVLGPKGDADDIQAISDVILSGWWVNGPKVSEFESKFANMVQSKYAVALTSNTAGLDLVLKAYGITNCDVISPTISFATTVAVPLWNNCTSRLADVDPVNHNIDPADVQRMIRPDTKAIICVNMAGIPAPINEIRKFFKGLIIEDCAHSCYVSGAGTQGDVAIWSFQGVKTMPCGDGGMVTTNSKEIADKIRRLSWFGIESTYSRDKNSGRFDSKATSGAGYRWGYDITELGYKAYMIDLNASLALAQMGKLESNLARRRDIQARYNQGLSDVLQIPPYSHTVQHYCAKVASVQRDALIKFLSTKNIHTSVHFKPLHKLTYFKDERPFPVADVEWTRLITLPVHLNLSDSDVDYIIYWVRKFLASDTCIGVGHAIEMADKGIDIVTNRFDDYYEETRYKVFLKTRDLLSHHGVKSVVDLAAGNGHLVYLCRLHKIQAIGLDIVVPLELNQLFLKQTGTDAIFYCDLSFPSTFVDYKSDCTTSINITHIFSHRAIDYLLRVISTMSRLCLLHVSDSVAKQLQTIEFVQVLGSFYVHSNSWIVLFEFKHTVPFTPCRFNRIDQVIDI
jgi:dTDP-4-amino-4,6-dideoxygalactose transaminase